MQVSDKNGGAYSSRNERQTSVYGSKCVQGRNLNRALGWKLGELLNLVLTRMTSVVLDKLLKHSSSTSAFSLHSSATQGFIRDYCALEIPVKCPWNLTALSQTDQSAAFLPFLQDEVKSDWPLQSFNSEGFRLNTSCYGTRGQKTLQLWRWMLPLFHKGKRIPLHTEVSFNPVTHQVVQGSGASQIMCCNVLFIGERERGRDLYLIHLFRAIFYPHKRHLRDSSPSLDEQKFSTALFQPGMGMRSLTGGWERSTKTYSTRSLAFGGCFIQDPEQSLNLVFQRLKLSAWILCSRNTAHRQRSRERQQLLLLRTWKKTDTINQSFVTFFFFNLFISSKSITTLIFLQTLCS